MFISQRPPFPIFIANSIYPLSIIGDQMEDFKKVWNINILIRIDTNILQRLVKWWPTYSFDQSLNVLVFIMTTQLIH